MTQYPDHSPDDRAGNVDSLHTLKINTLINPPGIREGDPENEMKKCFHPKKYY
jgi:hypothetical protein